MFFRSIICFFTFILFFSQALALKIWVGEPKASSQISQTAQTVGQLIETSLEEMGYTVVSSRAEADFLIVSQVVSLGSAYLVMLKKVQGTDVVFSTKTKSPSIEKLDEVVARAVRAVMSGQSPKKDLRVGEVPEEEVNVLDRRIKSKNFRIFGFGPTTATHLDTDKTGYYIVTGYAWEVIPKAAVRLKLEGALFPDKVSAFSGNIGANYYFSDASVSPYIGGDFGYGVFWSDSLGTASGFSVGAGLGLIFFRTSSVQMDLQARVLTVFDENNEGQPSLALLRLGIYY